jgi:hypothetical protein
MQTPTQRRPLAPTTANGDRGEKLALELELELEEALLTEVCDDIRYTLDNLIDSGVPVKRFAANINISPQEYYCSMGLDGKQEGTPPYTPSLKLG